LESEQQQMQVKLNELIDDNERLRKRASEAETAHQQLQDKEQEQNLTLQQANQFYEQENLRLEGQMEALENRAQKAELGYRKSEQLVISLKDNIKLLRAQMEQIQQQLVESQQQSELKQNTPEPAVHDLPEPADEEETYIEHRTDSELMIDGFPSSKPVDALKNESAPVVQLFAEPSQLTSEEVEKSAPKVSEAFTAPATPVESEKPNISIPAYRIPEPEERFKERKPLSSFAIASLILVAVLFAGFGYFYFSWQDDPADTINETSAEATSTDLIKTGEPAQTEKTGQPPSEVPTGSAAPTQQVIEARNTTPPPSPRASDPISTAAADEEARLQAELTLRQIAEEEFQKRLRDSGVSAPQAPEASALQQTVTASPEPLEQPVSATVDQTVEPVAEDQLPDPKADLVSTPDKPQPLEPANSQSAE
jgi:hypothetical protein